jgi:hypothetical protein
VSLCSKRSEQQQQRTTFTGFLKSTIDRGQPGADLSRMEPAAATDASYRVEIVAF